MARRLYGAADTVNDDSAALGFRVVRDEDEEQETWVWPENAEAVLLFETMRTQWVFEPFSGRRIGLRYETIQPTMELLGLDGDKRELFTGLRIMEAAVMDPETRK